MEFVSYLTAGLFAKLSGFTVFLACRDEDLGESGHGNLQIREAQFLFLPNSVIHTSAYTRQQRTLQ